MVFVEGLLFGLGMILFIGPVFFTLLNVSLSQGFYAGLALATGIIVSDILCIFICSLGTKFLFEDPTNHLWVSILACIVLFGFGVFYLIKKPIQPELTTSTETYSLLTGFTKGFLINFVNPFVFLVWISLIGYTQNKYNTNNDTFVFLSATILGIFSTDLLKVILAHKLRKFVSFKTIKLLQKITGIVLLLFGFRMIWYVIKIL